MTKWQTIKTFWLRGAVGYTTSYIRQLRDPARSTLSRAQRSELIRAIRAEVVQA